MRNDSCGWGAQGLISILGKNMCNPLIECLLRTGFWAKPFFFPLDFPGGSDGTASAYNAGDLGSIPGSGRSPGEGNGNPLQYSCLDNPVDGGAWSATVHRIAKNWT